MIHKIAEGTFDPKPMLGAIVNGGMSRTNGMPLIIFLRDGTILKFMYHFKTDYDLALEREGKQTAQWQGLNSALITDVLLERVPGHTGINKVFNNILCKGQTKKVYEALKALGADVPDFLVNYFEFCYTELQSGAAYDEFTVTQMEEYYGFLTNIYNVPSLIGLYKSLVTGTLFDVVYHYFKIRHHVPTFRHNDLHMENIMMLPLETVTDVYYTKFVIDEPGRAEEIYYVPYFGFEPRIIDFGLSEIPECGLNSVLEMVASRNMTIMTGHETKQLLRFIDFDLGELLGYDVGVIDEFSRDGLTCHSSIFADFKSKGKNDPREQRIRAEYFWTK